ncbi:MAG: hypothetical protein AAF211_34440, partial [Myxococcota bacterium]
MFGESTCPSHVVQSEVQLGSSGQRQSCVRWKAQVPIEAGGLLKIVVRLLRVVESRRYRPEFDQDGGGVEGCADLPSQHERLFEMHDGPSRLPEGRGGDAEGSKSGRQAPDRLQLATQDHRRLCEIPSLEEAAQDQSRGAVSLPGPPL